MLPWSGRLTTIPAATYYSHVLFGGQSTHCISNHLSIIFHKLLLILLLTFLSHHPTFHRILGISSHKQDSYLLTPNRPSSRHAGNREGLVSPRHTVLTCALPHFQCITAAAISILSLSDRPHCIHSAGHYPEKEIGYLYNVPRVPGPPKTRVRQGSRSQKAAGWRSPKTTTSSSTLWAAGKVWPRGAHTQPVGGVTYHPTIIPREGCP